MLKYSENGYQVRLNPADKKYHLSKNGIYISRYNSLEIAIKAISYVDKMVYVGKH